jgi:hypothetical protein
MRIAALLPVLFLAQAPAPQPPRDTRAVTVAAPASIGGRVVDDTGAPLPGAWIVLAGGPPPGARTAITTEEGRFRIDDVPAGMYTIEVGRPGYPRVRHGQRRRNGPGSVIEMAGQPLSLRLVLPRGAAISGTLVDEQGRPQAGSLTVIPDAAPAASRNSAAAHAITDGGGRFRVAALPAGAYRISARSTPQRYDGDAPGGTVVTVAAGEERSDIVVTAAAPAPTTLLTVSAAAADGTATRSYQVTLRRRGQAQNWYMLSRPNPDGTRTFSDVPAGTYFVIARNGPYIGGADVMVDGEHPAAVAITMARGVRVTGTATFDDRALHARSVMLALMPADDGALIDDNNAPMGRIEADGRFTLTAPPGRYVLRVTSGGRDDWSLQSARTGDEDVTDLPIAIGANGTDALAIALTRARTVLRGRVADASGAPINGVDVVVFPAERKYLVRNSRRVRSMTTGIGGDYEISDLPPGRYALAVVEDVDQMALRDPSTVATLKPLTTLTLGPGETKQHDVTVK